jgi:hypothetical protein
MQHLDRSIHRNRQSSPDVQVVGRPGAGTILKLLPRALAELENSIVGPRLQM